MRFFRQVLRYTAAVGASVLLAVSVGAQVVTGTITGTVKDAQGGVIPGATITLTSDTRGTASAPVVTNSSGDFVFPNVSAGTYTIQVEMPSFRTLRRSGVAVHGSSGHATNSGGCDKRARSHVQRTQGISNHRGQPAFRRRDASGRSGSSARCSAPSSTSSASTCRTR